MAKRKELKKAIHLVCEELLVEAVAYGQIHPSVPAADLENIAQSIFMMQEDFVSRLSHVDKRQTGVFFRKLKEDLSVSTNELVDLIFQMG